MANDNLSLAIGYKGSGKPQAIPVYQDQGAFLKGGFAALDDAQVVRFGRLASENPSGTDGEFYMGIPTGYTPVGIVLYEAGIAQNDPSRLGVTVGEYLPGQPMTVMEFGQFWLATFTTVGYGSIQPILGATVMVNTVTGDIEFLPAGEPTAPTGFTLAPWLTVKSMGLDTSGVMLLAKF